MCSPNMSPAFPIRSEAASERRDFTRFGGNRQQRARTGLSPDLGCVGEPSALFTRVTRLGPIVRFSLSLPIESPLPRARARERIGEGVHPAGRGMLVQPQPAATVCELDLVRPAHQVIERGSELGSEPTDGELPMT